MSPEALVVALFLPATYVSVFLHELGHAVAARLCGAVPTSFGLGTGWLFFTRSVAGVRVYLGARRPFLGIAFSLYPQLLPSRWREVGYLSGGAAVNTLAAALSLALAAVWPRAAVIWLTLAGVNALLAASALLPIAFGVGAMTLYSDGYLILRTLRGGAGPLDTANFFRVFERLSGLWRRSGDLRTLRHYTTTAAAVWLELGDPARANELLEEAGNIAAEQLPPLRAYDTLVRGLAALATGDADTAAAGIFEAEAEFRRLDHPVGSLLAASARADLMLKRGDAQGAMAQYQELAARPLLRQRDASWAGILFQIRACLAELSGDADALLAAYEAVPSRRRTALQDMRVYRSAARAYCNAGRQEQAAAAFAKALEAAAALDAAFVGDDRGRFRLAQVGWIREAQAGLRLLTRVEEAARLDTFFPSPAELDRRKRAALERQHRTSGKVLRWGLGITLLNAAVVTAAVTVAVLTGPHHRRPAIGGGEMSLGEAVEAHFGIGGVLLGTLLAFLTACAVLFGLPIAAVSRWVPSLRQLGATLVLLFSAMPWLIILIVMFLVAVRDVTRAF